MSSLSEGFWVLGNINGTILALDGTHIEFTKPSNLYIDYYNRKQVFSLNFIYLVDHKKRFRNIKDGYGRFHNSSIYSNSNMKLFVDNLPYSYHVVADPVFRSFYNIFDTYNRLDIDPAVLYEAKKNKEL